MNFFIKKVENLILSNTIWIFFTVILLAGLILTKDSSQPGWAFYMRHILVLATLFAPVLIFSGYRRHLIRRLEQTRYRILWVLCFIAYPLLLALGHHYLFNGFPLFPGVYDSVPDAGVHIILAAGIALLLSEIAIQVNDYRKERRFRVTWLKNLNLEKSLIILLLILSVLCIAGNNLLREENTGIQKSTTFWMFISFSLQFFLILLCYYFFYFVNHYFLINKLLKQKGILYYGFGMVFTLILFYPLTGQLISSLPMVVGLGKNGQAVFQEDSHAVIPLTIMVLSFPIIVAIQWYKQNSEIAFLEKEKAATELDLLKQQINPHFFFNTLNNLYALSITNDKSTPEVIMQLSELMRYVIYKGKKEKVPVADEVKYMEDYIRLQQIRLHKKLDFRFDKDIARENLMVPPLLFVIFIENAFKHGIEPAENNCFLHIRLKCDDRTLLFTCRNSTEEKTSGKEGIGLHNLRRRLELAFPDKHKLHLEENQHSFTATLKLTLT